jgi:hypothetical protein
MSSPHTHLPDQTLTGFRRVMNEIQVRAVASPNAPSAAIVEEELRNVNPTDEEAYLNLSEKNTLVLMANRFQNNTQPRLPLNLENCVIIPLYNTTLTGELFPKYDFGPLDPNRILIFYTDQGLRSFANSAYLFSDGTFDTVPGIFFKLYTIHTNIFGFTFPCIYILCARKNKATYDNIYMLI